MLFSMLAMVSSTLHLPPKAPGGLKLESPGHRPVHSDSLKALALAPEGARGIETIHPM